MADKLYYTIGEVSKMFQVNASLIRFWEKEFKIINPRKKSFLLTRRLISGINTSILQKQKWKNYAWQVLIMHFILSKKAWKNMSWNF